MTVIAPSSNGATDTHAGPDSAFSRFIASPPQTSHHLTSDRVAVATYKRTINGWFDRPLATTPQRIPRPFGCLHK